MVAVIIESVGRGKANYLTAMGQNQSPGSISDTFGKQHPHKWKAISKTRKH